MVKIENPKILPIGTYMVFMNAHINTVGCEQTENTSQFDKNVIKNYHEDANEEWFLEDYVQYSRKLHDLYNDLSILPERVKTEKAEKFLAHLHNNKNALHINNF